jgi:hypothetical protein
MMNKKAIISILAGFAISMVSTVNAYSQLENVGLFMAGGVEDGEKLMGAYLEPYVNGFAATLNSGWYNTAKAHKPLGFDILGTFNMAFTPSSTKTYDVAQLGLQTLYLTNPSESSIGQTISGSKDDGPMLGYIVPGVDTLDAFRTPPGTNNPYIMSPMIQAGVGIYKGTEIIGRYMPKIKFSGTSYGLWGIGLKHNIDQWIPLFKRLPVLNISIMGGYTVLNSDIAVHVTPEMIGTTSSEPASTWEDQRIAFEVRSFTANLIISANLPVIGFYGGAGFASTNSTLALKGYYPVIDITSPTLTSIASELDPMSLEMKNKDGGITKPRLNAGFRLKFSVITFNFDYTWATYSSVTGGFGITVR